MITSKTTYETSDGKSFETKYEAEIHEESLENGTYIFVIAKQYYNSYSMSIIFASDSYSKILNKKKELEDNNLTENYSYSIQKVIKI